MELVLVAALGENRVIGTGRSVPWDVPEDVRHYKSTVAGHPVIVGRRTFESMDRLAVPLHVVLTTDASREAAAPDVTYVRSPGEAVGAAAETGSDRAYVIGGGEIYRLFLPYADGALLSHIEGTYEGGVTFPELGPSWEERERERRDGFDVVRYENTAPEPLPGP
ncbi:MAG: dihydrofolate reductase [Halorientalis sp.]